MTQKPDTQPKRPKTLPLIPPPPSGQPPTPVIARRRRTRTGQAWVWLLVIVLLLVIVSLGGIIALLVITPQYADPYIPGRQLTRTIEAQTPAALNTRTTGLILTEIGLQTALPITATAQADALNLVATQAALSSMGTQSAIEQTATGAALSFEASRTAVGLESARLQLTQTRVAQDAALLQITQTASGLQFQLTVDAATVQAVRPVIIATDGG